jgi:integrase
MKAARKTLRQLGAKGADDRVRVLEDPKADSVVVQYKDGRGVSRKRTFPLTRQGRKDAIAWGDAYHAERMTGQGARPETTHAQLWKAYSESQAFTSRRVKTRQNYTERWRKWMHFRGERTRVDETTLLHVDQFYAARKAAGKSANQTRGIISVARIVYNWGQQRKLVTSNELALFRWQTTEGEEANEPEEYTEGEFLAILAQLPAQSWRTWRAHVALMLAGHQGVRANAALHLAWPDVHADEALFIWPAGYQKNRRELAQPMTWDAVAALETARYWRQRAGYAGPWVLFAHGGDEGDDEPYRYASLHRQLYGGKNKDGSRYVGAEARAGIAHKARRALHGFRKMVAGNVADRTGDDRLGMEFIGDRDMKQAKKYLKRRSERMERAAGSVETKAPERTPQDSTRSVPEVSRADAHEKAPGERGPQPVVAS